MRCGVGAGCAFGCLDYVAERFGPLNFVPAMPAAASTFYQLASTSGGKFNGGQPMLQQVGGGDFCVRLGHAQLWTQRFYLRTHTCRGFPRFPCRDFMSASPPQAPGFRASSARTTCSQTLPSLRWHPAGYARRTALSCIHAKGCRCPSLGELCCLGDVFPLFLLTPPAGGPGAADALLAIRDLEPGPPLPQAGVRPHPCKPLPSGADVRDPTIAPPGVRAPRLHACMRPVAPGTALPMTLRPSVGILQAGQHEPASHTQRLLPPVRGADRSLRGLEQFAWFTAAASRCAPQSPITLSTSPFTHPSAPQPFCVAARPLRPALLVSYLASYIVYLLHSSDVPPFR